MDFSIKVSLTFYPAAHSCTATMFRLSLNLNFLISRGDEQFVATVVLISPELSILRLLLNPASDGLFQTLFRTYFDFTFDHLFRLSCFCFPLLNLLTPKRLRDREYQSMSHNYRPYHLNHIICRLPFYRISFVIYDTDFRRSCSI